MNVEMPDGTIIEGVPDGTSQADVLARWQRAGEKAPAAPQDAVDPMAGMPGWQRALVGAGAEFTDWGLAAKQMLARPANAVGLVSDESLAGLEQEGRDKAAIDKRLESDTGAKVGRLTANVAAGLAPVSTVRGAAALGAVMGALVPTANEQQRLASMLLSGSLGAAGQALGNKIASWAKGGKAAGATLSPEELSIVQAAQRRGYDLTPAQASKSRTLQSLETQLSSLPGAEGAMAERRGAQRDLFNRELFATMGQPAPAGGAVGAGTTEATQRAIGGRLQAAAAGQPMQMEQELFQDLAATLQKHERLLSPDQRAIVLQYVESIPSRFDGADYQRWRSQIGARAASTTDSELKGALKGIQKALDSAFDRQAGPEASAAMRQARGDYRNFKTLQPLIAKAEAQGERISPMSVAQRAATEGNLSGEVAELGRIGRVIGREGPNSGTAQNQFWRSVLTGGGAPAAMSGGVAGAGLGYAINGPEGAATGGAVGGPLALAGALLGPRLGASAYLSRALRDRTLSGVEREAARSLGNPSALAAVLRKIGAATEPELQALARAGALGVPSVALPALQE